MIPRATMSVSWYPLMFILARLHWLNWSLKKYYQFTQIRLQRRYADVRREDGETEGETNDAEAGCSLSSIFSVSTFYRLFPFRKSRQMKSWPVQKSVHCYHLNCQCWKLRYTGSAVSNPDRFWSSGLQMFKHFKMLHFELTLRRCRNHSYLSRD